MKDTSFYNKESGAYSEKRYPKLAADYAHFFFKKRLSVLLSMLERITARQQGIRILEIGCADGVVAAAMSDLDSVGAVIGIDISADMIEEAKSKNRSPKISFFVRGQEDQRASYDVIVEVGVLNLTDRNLEYAYADDHLKVGGYYICSLASRTSLRARIKFRDDGGGFAHLLTFEEYEKELRERFEVIKSVPYGLFIPFLWRSPMIGRFLQPLEAILRPLGPRLFHEKIYLLRKK